MRSSLGSAVSGSVSSCGSARRAKSQLEKAYPSIVPVVLRGFLALCVCRPRLVGSVASAGYARPHVSEDVAHCFGTFACFSKIQAISHTRVYYNVFSRPL